jgi:LDH2 family malate/lactate/ureidoglycolate dehydrogenase
MKEPVTALYLGNFSFKGSGSYEMVQLLHGVLVGREFSQEAPKGKGMRLSVGYGEVPVLPQVQLQIPARVIAARNVYAVAAGAAGAETD